MKTKEEIVANWLPRYTKRPLEEFGKYILLTNFTNYVEIFADKFNVPIVGRDANMCSASANGITIINFGMGSPNAAIIMDLLSAVKPKACLFLGKCGESIKRTNWATLSCPLQLFVVRVLVMTIFHPKFQLFLHLCCSVQFLPQYATSHTTTGLVLSILPTVVFGNMMTISRNTLRRRMQGV